MSSVSYLNIVQWLKKNAQDVTDRAKLELQVPKIADELLLHPKNPIISEGITKFLLMPRPFTSVSAPLSCEGARDQKFQIVSGDYFNRLSDYLIEKKHRSLGVVTRLSDEADKVAENLSVPNTNEKRKGQVVGFVQSGKTANMAALCAKAMDGGYKAIVIFAGVLNNLREQTQVRLQSELIGSSGSDNVKMIENLMEPISLTHQGETEKEGDVGRESERKLKSHETTNNSGENIYLFIVKKNPQRLKFLKKLFSGRLRNTPTLVIDDESDQASINSGTNSAIRDFLGTLLNYTFVGYSATPYANFLIDMNEDDDLYPKDFIISLNEPPQYFGARRVFGLPRPDEDDELNALPVNCQLDSEDVDDLISSIKRKEKVKTPDFMMRGIVTYLLASAVRDIRSREFPAEVDSRFKSMLIHVHSEINGHTQITKMSRQIIEELKTNLNKKTFLDYVQKVWQDEFLAKKDSFQESLQQFNEAIEVGLRYNCDVLLYPDFQEVFEKVQRIIPEVQVRKVHSNGDHFSYVTSDTDRKVPEYCIVIGGNKLSRGFTVEGLMISLFLRTTNQADTLMQMGRWFGYRPGYVDLTRVMTTNDIYNRFVSLAYMEDQMREDIKARIVQGLTPKDLPPKLKVLGGLRLTSATKMGAGILLGDFNSVYQKTSWNKYDKNSAIDNLKVYLSNVDLGSVADSDDAGRILFSKQFSGTEVSDLLKAANFKEEALILIRTQMERVPNLKWNFAFAGKKVAQSEDLVIGGVKTKIRIVQRGVKNNVNENIHEFGVIHSNSDFNWVKSKKSGVGNEGVVVLYMFRASKDKREMRDSLYLTPVVMFPDSAKFDEQIIGQRVPVIEDISPDK